MKGLLLIVGLLLSAGVRADISFAELTELSRAPARHEGRFTQEKYIRSVDASLHSNGKFAYRRGESIRWQTLQPIRSKLLLTPEGIRSDQGLLLQLDSNPMAAAMGEVLFALLTADWDRLAEYFELSGNAAPPRWQAVLVPRKQALDQWFVRIELAGSALPEQIVIHERSGNRTTIRLD